MRIRRLIALLPLLLVLAAPAAAAGPSFSARVTNPWFPLPVGAKWTYVGTKDSNHKMYVRGIGIVLEQTERGLNERNELVSFVR